MPLFDYRSDTSASYSIEPQSMTTAALTGTAVDLGSSLGAVVVYAFGSAGGTAAITPVVHESSDNASWSTADSSVVSGSGHATAIVGTGAGTAVRRIVSVGYNGTKRYIRAYINLSGTATCPVSATVVKFVSVKPGS